LSDDSAQTRAPDPSATAVPPSAAALFGLAWESLVDVLGSGTAATLMRRAAARAVVRCDELKDFSVVREKLEYRCVLPVKWSDDRDCAALRELFLELGRLLVELTGPVVVDRLRTLPALEQSRLFAMESAS
jgi:hypothetical protein